MKISKIEKKKRLYLLELDGRDKLYVTEDTIVRFMLSKDKDISAEELSQIKEFSQFSYGKNLALYHLSFKQRTEKEVRDYLIKHDIDSQIIGKVIANLKDDKWLDDQKLAQQYIEQNLHNGDKGPYVLKQKLLQKGIAGSIIDQALEDCDFSPLCQKVAQKVAKKYQDRLPSKALENKIIQSLSNKGFSFQEAKSAYAYLELDKDEDTEADLLDKELDKLHRKYSRKYQGYELKQRLTQALARKGFDFDLIRAHLRDYL